MLAISSDGTHVPRGTLRAEHRERSSCVGNVCGSRPALARRGLRASVSVGRGGCPGRGHLRDAGVPRLPTSRPGVSPVSGRSLRAPVSGALPARGSLRRLRPGTRVLDMAHATRGARAADAETLAPSRLSAGRGARVRGARPRRGIGMGDDLSDLSEERPLPDPVDLSEATPAHRCQCRHRWPMTARAPAAGTRCPRWPGPPSPAESADESTVGGTARASRAGWQARGTPIPKP